MAPEPASGVRRATPPAERPGVVQVENGGGLLRIRLTGAVDAVLAPRLDTVVADVVAAQPIDVRLDLAEVDFLGSHGMAFLVRIQHAVRAAGRVAAVDAASRHARVALRIAGLEHFLNLS
ncbi:STAS domain-containing protein [Cryptosporangium aurantiacum]|uniref:Anti-anti-sigma factor n=1 Tax=Cryptosporangium aurantiacum TaxID=134849 RepID=A0A1M7JKH9_9ACTN|nr:STAS domain-containing protein [Cryptosporangium aurantiacum]SHM53273.1 anti-anti-sigma factor [Cryptosporangium aurantiacum]